MRILYVALTRAKEKIIITGISNDASKSLKQKQELLEMYEAVQNKDKKINSKLIKKYKTYLDWLELVYIFNKEDINKVLTLDIHSKDEVLKNEKRDDNTEEINVMDKIKEKVKNVKYDEKLFEVLNWKYKFADSISIPTKTSVTQVKELEQEKKFKFQKYNIETDELSNISIKDSPKFLAKEEKITGAKKGTLMHLCMQKMIEKMDYSFDDIKDLIQDLVKKEIILPNEAEAINIKQLLQYTKSNLWNELKNAKEIHKEQPFYLNMSAKEIFGMENDDYILVQGIIDLYYINSNNQLILVDYKTDYINEKEEEQLIIKYKKQLELYKRALEKSTGKVVEKVYIYSTVLNKEILL